MTSHLNEYLDFYKEREFPGYAVLVTGEWGTGKTFQVKQALKEYERYYVSLFGLQTADDVHFAMLAEMDPNLAKARKFFDSFGDAANRLGGPFKLASPKKNWRTISMALKGRYEGNRLKGDLQSEKDWVKEIIKLLDAEAAKTGGIQALRIKRAVPPNLRASVVHENP